MRFTAPTVNLTGKTAVAATAPMGFSLGANLGGIGQLTASPALIFSGTAALVNITADLFIAIDITAAIREIAITCAEREITITAAERVTNITATS